MSKAERRWALTWAAIVVGLTCLPYLAAWWLAPAGTQYTGLLVNPADGESYYSKMQQGARGDWLFHLAYTPERHQGAAVYTYYLALGHLASALGLPIPLVYHLARAAGGVFFLFVAYALLARVFHRVRTRRVAFLLLGVSAGLGWLLAPVCPTIADLWVAEGFTFLSILTNPHFPLGTGLMVLLFLIALAARDPGHQAAGRARMATLAGLGAAAGLLLAIVQPFGVPVVLAVLAVYLATLAWQHRRLPWHDGLLAAAIALGAAPAILYSLYVLRTNWALAAWSAQNLTLSLPPWEYALGYGLVLILALAGVPAAVRRRQPVDILLLCWIGTTIVLLYVPFSLQRRFISGLHVPLAILAAVGIEQVVWPRLRARAQRLATAMILGISMLTNILLPVAAVASVAQGGPPLVMSADEAQAWAWLGANSAWTDTVLAPVETAILVPAWAGNRVVCGHRFETIDFYGKKADVEQFYSAVSTAVERRSVLQRYGVRYVYSPDAAALSASQAAEIGLAVAWRGGRAAVYRVEGRP